MNQRRKNPYQTPERIPKPCNKSWFSFWKVGWLAVAMIFFGLSIHYIIQGLLVRQNSTVLSETMNNIPASVLTEHPGKGIGTACLGIACVLIALGWKVPTARLGL